MKELSKVWEIDPATLGVYVTGMGQRHSDAQSTIQQAGQTAIIEYAGIVFAACNSGSASTVNRKNNPGDKRCLIRCQEKNSRSDFLRLRPPP